MTTISREYQWDMGHRLPQHNGKCQRLHGHRYRAEVDITGPVQTTGPAAGMVMDFFQLDELIQQAIGSWDHRTMLYEHDPLLKLFSDDDRLDIGVLAVPFEPTAELIAREILQRLQWAKPLSVGWAFTRVRVYETPRSWAEVRK